MSIKNSFSYPKLCEPFYATIEHIGEVVCGVFSKHLSRQVSVNGVGCLRRFRCWPWDSLRHQRWACINALLGKRCVRLCQTNRRNLMHCTVTKSTCNAECRFYRVQFGSLGEKKSNKGQCFLQKGVPVLILV